MDPQALIDRAFKNASTASHQRKRSKMVKRDVRFMAADEQRILTASKTIILELQHQMKQSEREFSEFENELMKTMVDYNQLNKDRKRIATSIRMIGKMEREYSVRAKFARNADESNRLRKEFYGRVCSIIKKLSFVETERFARSLGTLPHIKKMDTIIICGYPNVGKSQILSQMSSQKVEVANYPFTTKDLLMGYVKKGYDTVQLIDTPGILDRPMEKRNEIEKKAILALKHLSKNYLFVIDPSEQCSYSLESQTSLMHEVRKLFGGNMFVVSTHADCDQKPFKADMNINALDKNDVEALRKRILDHFFGWKHG